MWRYTVRMYTHITIGILVVLGVALVSRVWRKKPTPKSELRFRLHRRWVGQ